MQTPDTAALQALGAAALPTLETADLKSLNDALQKANTAPPGHARAGDVADSIAKIARLAQSLLSEHVADLDSELGAAFTSAVLKALIATIEILSTHPLMQTYECKADLTAAVAAAASPAELEGRAAEPPTIARAAALADSLVGILRRFQAAQEAAGSAVPDPASGYTPLEGAVCGALLGVLTALLALAQARSSRGPGSGWNVVSWNTISG